MKCFGDPLHRRKNDSMGYEEKNVLVLFKTCSYSLLALMCKMKKKIMSYNYNFSRQQLHHVWVGWSHNECACIHYETMLKLEWAHPRFIHSLWL